MLLYFRRVLFLTLSLSLFFSTPIAAYGDCSIIFSESKSVTWQVVVSPRKRIERARSVIKSEFVGNDREIDRIFDEISQWYIDPSVRTRPLVISIWSITGYGKTTVVNRILEELGVEFRLYHHMDRFTEGQRTALFDREILKDFYETDRETYDHVELVRLRQVKNPVLILDEFQQIYTRGDRGESIERTGADEIWQLLGNGRLSIGSGRRYSMQRALEYDSSAVGGWDENFSRMQYQGRKEERRYKSELSRIRSEIKRDLEMIPRQDLIDFSQGLIFLLGNLDPLFGDQAEIHYSESFSTNELHRKTREITRTQVKEALGEKFRPEHVRRIGSRIIVFPTLSEESFDQLFEKRTGEILTYAREKGIQLEITESLKQRILEEGVLPTQGVTPLLEMVEIFLMDRISDYIHLLKKHYTRFPVSKFPVRIRLDIEEGASEMIATILTGQLKGTEVRNIVPSDSLARNRLFSEPKRSMAAVYFAAKTTSLIALSDTIPLRVSVASSRSDGWGFIIEGKKETENDRVVSRQGLVHRVAVLLSGYIASHQIFKESSLAAAQDLQRAQLLVEKAVKQWGLVEKIKGEGEFIISELREISDDAISYDTSAREIVGQILNREVRFFAELTNILREQPQVNQEKLVELKEKYWVGGRVPQRENQRLDEFLRDPSGLDFFLPMKRRKVEGFQVSPRE